MSPRHFPLREERFAWVATDPFTLRRLALAWDKVEYLCVIVDGIRIANDWRRSRKAGGK